jgi:MFS family permease
VTPAAGKAGGPLAVVAVVGIPIFLAIANQTMVSVALPAVGADLGELAHLPWLVVGYMLALTIAGPVYGVLGDSHGRSRMLMVALVVYVAGSALATVAQSIEVLALGRLVQGLGGGGLMSLSQALIGDMVAPRERGRAQGYVASIGTMASTLGPVVGGVLVATVGWRGLFAGTIPLAALAALILWRSGVPGAGGQRRPFDVTGFLWLNAFTVALTVGIEAARVPGQALFAAAVGLAGVACLMPLVRSQGRSANPMFPPPLFAISAIVRASVMVTCHGAALVSLTTLLPLWQTILRGDGVLDISLTMLALTVAFGLSGIVTGNLITLTGRTAVFPAVGLPMAAGGIVALTLVGPELPRAGLMAVYGWIGICIGTVMSVIHTTVQDASPQALRGRASGAVTFFRSIGAVVGTAVVSLVLFTMAPGGADSAVLTGDAMPATDLAGWETAFRWALFTVTGFVLGAWSMAATTPARQIG